MKKLVMFLSFALIMGVVTANAQAPKKAVKKEAVKTEVPAKKVVKKDAKAAPVKKVVKKDAKAAPVKK